MARLSKKRGAIAAAVTRPNVETPERLVQAGGKGRIVDVPTEAAGVAARQIRPKWQILLDREVIDQRQAAAAAIYVIAREKVEAVGAPVGCLALPQVHAGAGPRAPNDRDRRAIVNFGRVTDALGADLPLVEGIINLELRLSRPWHQERLRSALDRLAATMGIGR